MINKKSGNLPEGKGANVYTFNNKNGVEMTVSDLGAVLVSVMVPDKDGKKTDVVLGYDNADAYAKNINTYFGATIGRNGNRVAGGRFRINGKEYQMEQNEGKNNLHSGPDGYQIRLWDVESVSEENNRITFLLESNSGDQGFPGSLVLKVTYLLTEKNEIRIIYEGISDEDTVFNPTNHSYFNLGGHDSGTILEHILRIYADGYTPVADSTSIPTGIIEEVEGTPMDFRQGKKIGKDIDKNFEQLAFTGGYDHNFVLLKKNGGTELAAEAECVDSGISMKVYTDLPGVQFYAGNFIHNEPGKNGSVYQKRNGFCLETQYYPNAVNVPAFPSPVIKAGKVYRTETVYQFLSVWKKGIN